LKDVKSADGTIRTRNNNFDKQESIKSMKSRRSVINVNKESIVYPKASPAFDAEIEKGGEDIH